MLMLTGMPNPNRMLTGRLRRMCMVKRGERELDNLEEREGGVGE